MTRQAQALSEGGRRAAGSARRRPARRRRASGSRRGAGALAPIADSLAAVPDDLGSVKAAAVVLVTDGQETCDGDPAAVIESLADKGVEVTVNIVGFAIDDEALERQFAEWAELGDGRYFSAADEEGLKRALQDALQVPYTVFDAAKKGSKNEP